MSFAPEPLLLDIASMAKEARTLEGQWPLSALPRLHDMAVPGDHTAQALVDWSLTGQLRHASGEPHQTWLTVSASVPMAMTCQRCLQAVVVPVQVTRDLRFVKDEAQAAQLDTDSEDDVLAMNPRPEARDLVEDELLLALPLVPRHETCPVTLPASVGEDELTPAENPFAVLSQLKGGAR